MNLVGFDLETWGQKPEYALQPFRRLHGLAGIRAVSVATDTAVKGVLNPDRDYLRGILIDAAAQQSYLVGWNVAFDCAWLIAEGLREEVFRVKWLDGMLLWRHWFVKREDEKTPKSQRQSYSLENALQKWFPEAAGIKEFTDFQTTDPTQLQKLLERNRGDADYTRRLAAFFISQLNTRQLDAALIEARCVPLVAWANVCGLTINREATESLDSSLERVARETLTELQQSNPEVTEKVIASSQQLADLLFNQWGLAPIKQTPVTDNGGGGTDSTDKEVLYELAFHDPRARLVKNIREARNNRTKFVEAVNKSLKYNTDGRVRPQARIFGTYTSRMTYSSKQKARTVNAKGREVKTEQPIGVALHQWKRDPEFRRQIAAPEGYTLVEFDFAGQEFRWMAVASGDETMLSLCLPGEDAHSYMGAQIVGQDYRDFLRRYKAGGKQEKQDRNLGKFSNLSFQYRISARAATAKARVQYELDVLEPFVAQILGTYKLAFPGVPQYWQSQIYLGKAQGFVETFAGRRVQLVGSWAGQEKWPLESTAINYPIQGTGGDQKYLALAVARNHLPTYGAHFYFELHDGLFFICPTPRAERFTETFKPLLSQLPYKAAWGIDLPIQFPVDAKFGPTWGDLKEFP